MRKYLSSSRNIALAILVTLLSACTPEGMLVHSPDEQAKVTDPLVIARNSIDQAYAVHASITTTLLQNYHDGIITLEEKTALAAKTRDALNYLNSADDLLAAGNLQDANAKVQLAQTIFTALQLELAKQARKEKGQGN